MLPIPVASHAAEARSLLTALFANKAKVVAVLNSLTWHLDELEAVYQAIISCRLLANSPTGDALDQLGAIVGEARAGRSDVDYLTAVRLRIRVNRSQGTAEDIIQIANLIGPADYEESANYHWTVTIYNTPSARILIDLLGRAKAAGSYGVVRYSTTWPVADNLTYESVYGPVPGAIRGFTCVADDDPDPLDPRLYGKILSAQEAKRST
jgi:hypothetical protein